MVKDYLQDRFGEEANTLLEWVDQITDLNVWHSLTPKIYRAKNIKEVERLFEEGMKNEKE